MTSFGNTEQTLAELGRRFSQTRIDNELTQSDVADRAGVGKRTVERFEAGGDVQLSTLIRLLAVLNLAENLDFLLPEAKPSPMELLRQRKKQRRRASHRRKPDADTQPANWTWGDEQ